MSSEEFWFGNPQDYFVYQDAFAEKEEKFHDDIDIMSWKTGYYNMLGYRQVYNDYWGKGNKKYFPQEPMCISEKIEEEKRQADEMHPLLNKFMRMATAVNNKLKEE